MQNYNYWKDAYRDSWKVSSKREEELANLLEEKTGLEVEIVGFGAGSTDYLSGNAESYQHEKGDADLHIKGTNIFIEITGPLNKHSQEIKDLWFRPDKLNNAYKHRKDGSKDTFLINNVKLENLWFVIHVDDELCKRMINQEFKPVYPKIHGRNEIYISFPIEDRCIQTLDFLVDYLKDVKLELDRKNERISSYDPER